MNKIKRKKNFWVACRHIFDYYSSSDRIRCYNSFCLCFSKASSRRKAGSTPILISIRACGSLPQSTHTIRQNVIDWLTLPPSHRVVITMCTTMRERTSVGAMPAWLPLTVLPSTSRCLLRCVACLQLICVLDALSLCTRSAVLARTNAKVPLHVPRHGCPPQLTPLICLLSVCVSC